MPNFRRFYRANSLVFLTNSTKNRRPFLESTQTMELLFATMRNVQRIHPFRLFAYVFLPDHFHWLLYVDDEVGDFSKVMHSVKRNFTLAYKRELGITKSQQIWQARFWDHMIRNANDLENHFNYIHWNPVKHGYVSRPEDWPYSTYTHWLQRGYYRAGWGHEDDDRNQ